MSPDPAPPAGDGRQPIPPAKRRRLQTCFEHGSRSAAKNDFDYATQMFEMCVIGDPSNRIYVRDFLINLSKKYGDNKKGAGMSSAPRIKLSQAAMQKSQYSKDWEGLLKSGVEVLKLNPWNVSTLTMLAQACDEQNFDEAQLVYLEQALQHDPKDAEVNRLCGRALARLHQYDKSIAAWNRCLAAKPGDEEAQRAIADLAIEKTIHHGGYEGAENSTDVMADKAAKADRRSEATARLSPVQLLEKSIAKTPDNVTLYVELADLHSSEERHKQAEEVLTKALQVSGGDIAIRERLEDCQLRGSRFDLRTIEKAAAEKKTPEAIEQVKRMRAELNKVEMGVYRTRSERYPENPGLKYELGLRLKAAGQYAEAISCFQAALGDAKRKAQVHMALGECFQYIKQYKLAMKDYENALEATSLRDVDQRKLALYRAGKLALGLCEKYMAGNDPHAAEELDRAEKYLNDLAGLEFGYKDVPALLDKVSKIRHKG